MFVFLCITLQKLVMKKIITPRVPSNEASSNTVRTRSKIIGEMITQVSSTSEDNTESAALVQLRSLLHGKTRSELKEILNTEKLLEIKIPAGHELRLKCQMGWTWLEMRKLKR